MSKYVFLRLSFIPAILVSALAFFAIPSFVDTYKSFGATLPARTVFLFNFYKVLAFVPFLFLLAWFYWPRREARGPATLIISGFLSGVVLLFGIWAAYAPLVTLGSQP